MFRDILSHAYIFSGPAGVGKFDFALQVARQLLGEQGLESRHPDLHIYDGLNIEQARELKKKIALSPFSAQYKIVIINNAQSINTQASNSILKLLEEPQGDTIFFLITPNANLLLGTIRSRCYEVKFFYVDDKLIEKEFNTKPIESLRAHWSGRPACAKRMLENKEYKKEIETHKAECEAFLSGNLRERFKIIETYAGRTASADKKQDLEKRNQKLLQMLTIWIEHAKSRNRTEILEGLFNIYKKLSTTNANFAYMMRGLAINHANSR